MGWLLCAALPLDVAAGEVAVFETGIELTNTSGVDIGGATLDVKVAEDIPGLQRLARLKVDGAEQPVPEPKEGYLRLPVPRLAMGERLNLVITQEVVFQGATTGSSTADKALSPAVRYAGYRSRNSGASASEGDCTEMALAKRTEFGRQGIGSRLVSGVVLSTTENGSRLATPHDWLVLDAEYAIAARAVDPAQQLLPGEQFGYVALGYVEDLTRFPLYRVSNERIQVSLRFQHAQ